MPRRYNKRAGIASAILKGIGEFAGGVQNMRSQAAQNELKKQQMEQAAKPSSYKEFEFAKKEGYTESYPEWKTTTTPYILGEGGKKIGRLPGDSKPTPTEDFRAASDRIQEALNAGRAPSPADRAIVDRYKGVKPTRRIRFK